MAKVLWVDDEENILATVRRLFRDLPWELTTVASAHEALKILETEEFAVVISDQRMPEMSGIHFLSELRIRQPVASRVLATAFLDGKLLEDAVNKAGIFRFITKPWDIEELVNDLKSAVEHYQRSVRQRGLLHEVSRKKRELEGLTGKLEGDVEEQVLPTDQTRQETEKTLKQTKGLIRFIKEISQALTVEELLVSLRKELRASGIPRELVVGYSKNGRSSLFAFRGPHALVERRIKGVWPQGGRELSAFLADLFGRPFSSVFQPFELSLGEEKEQVAVLLEGYEELQEMMSERLEVFCLAIAKVQGAAEAAEVARKWEMTFDNIPQPILIVETGFNVIRGNDPFEGRDGKCFRRLNSLDSPCGGCPLADEEKPTAPVKGEILVGDVSHRVEVFPIRLNGSQSVSTFVNVYHDISESRRLYSKMLQTEKMAALGSLADNIAHELNNPLTGIRSIAQILISETKDDDPVKKDFEEIERAAGRCQGVISNLLEFSKGELGQKSQIVSVSKILDRTLPLLKTALRDHRYDVERAERDDLVEIVPQLLQQAIFNLIKNATEALEGLQGHIGLRVYTDKNNVYFEVKDDGPGVPEEIEKRIFEPFFSTKGPGKGTGLGVSMTRTVLRSFKGDLFLKREELGGACFVICLPKVKGA